MNTILIQGLRIGTKCKYVRIAYGDRVSVSEDIGKSLMTITVPEGFHGRNIVNSRVEVVEDNVIVPTKGSIPVPSGRADLNGLVLRKVVPSGINFNQFIVKDVQDYTVWYDDYRVVILIPECKLSDKETYLKAVSAVPWFDVVDSSGLQSPANIYGLNIGDGDIRHDSNNGFSFGTKAFYERYTLRMIDVLHSFITKLSKRMEDFGVQLVGFQLDENTLSPDNVKYRITELGRQISRPSFTVTERYAVKHRTLIDFELSASSFILCNDFKTRYQNYDLISDFTEFYTTDSHGVPWVSSVSWGEISTTYTQDFETDQTGSVASTAQFSCELNYYVVFDDTYPKIKKIITDIVGGGSAIGRTITV